MFNLKSLKMKNRILKYFVLSSFCLAFTCEVENEIEAPKPPGDFSLLSPANEAVCINNKFSWASSENATQYFLSVFDANAELLSDFPKETIENNITVVDLPKSTAITWFVTAINSDGEFRTNIWSASTPGEPVSNFVPAILEINIDKLNDTIYLKVKDAENEEMTYTLLLSDTNVFSNENIVYKSIVIVDDSEDDDVDSREFYIKNIGFRQGENNWIKIIIQDTHGNKVPWVGSFYYD